MGRNLPAMHIGETVRCAKTYQKVNVIGDAAHALCKTVCGSNDSTQIRMQVPAPRRLDHWLIIFCSENDVIMQAQVCR